MTKPNIRERFAALQCNLDHIDRIIDAAIAAKDAIEDAVTEIEECEADEVAAEEITCDLDQYADEIGGALRDLDLDV